MPHLCASLDEALENLDKDHAFLTRGGVFTDDMIEAYIALKYEEVHALPHDHAPGRVRHVLLGLSAARRRHKGRRGRPFLFCAPACPNHNLLRVGVAIPLILLLFP